MVRLMASPQSAQEVLEELGSDIPGLSEARVIHLLEAEDQEARAALRGAIADVAGALATFPALRVSQYVIAFVGREWDDPESHLLFGLDQNVAAVLVVARSNEAAVQLQPVEEEVMASDLAYALITSDLASRLHQDSFWLTGTSAVYYRRRVLVAALTAFHVGGFLRSTTLKELGSQHTECDEGTAWARGLGLGQSEHLDALDRAPMGGSLWRSARLDPQLFTDVPPEYLVDALRSFVHQRTDRLLKDAVEQVERNESQHRAMVETELVSAVKDLLQQRQNIARANRYVECAGAALSESLEPLQIALTHAEDDVSRRLEELDTIETELSRSIRRLPYPSSVAARSLGFGALGIAVYHAISGAAQLDPNFAVVGLGAGAVLALPLFTYYAALRRKIDGLRRRYLVVSEQHTQAVIKSAVLKWAVAEVEALQRFAVVGPDSLTGRVAALRESVEQIATRYTQRAADRVLGPLAVTRYSTFVPTVADLDTAALAKRFPLQGGYDLAASVLRSILSRSELGALDVDDVDSELQTSLMAALDATLWPDLSAVVKDSEASRRTAVDILGAATAPIVLVEKLAASGDGVQRLVTLDHRRDGALKEALAPTGVTGYLAPDDDDVVIQIAIRPVPENMRSAS